MDHQRMLLDKLMGVDRNKGLDGRRARQFTDPEICKNFLVACCPHEMFYNTKSDLGQCNSVHDEHLQTQYQASDKRYKLGYEQAFVQYVTEIIANLDRKIRIGKERLAKPIGESLLNPRKEEFQEKIVRLDVQIQELMTKMEKLGEEGNVDEASNLMRTIEQMKAEQARFREESNVVDPNFRHEQMMEICDLCGAFSVPIEGHVRQISHLEGKQHLGFVKLRQVLAEIKDELRNRNLPLTGGLVRDPLSPPERERGSPAEAARGGYDRGSSSGGYHRGGGSGGGYDRGSSGGYERGGGGGYERGGGGYERGGGGYERGGGSYERGGGGYERGSGDRDRGGRDSRDSRDSRDNRRRSRSRSPVRSRPSY